MQIHGTSDATVPYNGGAGWTEPITSLVDYWANFNNCDLTPLIENVPDINTSDGTTVEKYSYLNGDNCTEVIHYKVANGSHTWPGTFFTSAGTNHDINASLEIWKFLSQYDMNGLINCSSIGIEEKSETNGLAVYPNPANDYLEIEGLQHLNQPRQLTITDISGAEIYSTEKPDQIIDVSELARGVYFININHSAGDVSIKFVKN